MRRKMFKSAGKVIKVNRTELRRMGMITLFASMIASLGGIIILSAVKPEAYVCLGTIIALCCIMFLYILTGIFNFAADFNLALSMGITRKGFALGYYVRSTLTAVFMCAALAAVCFFETGLYGFLFPGMVSQMPKVFQFTEGWKLLLGICVAAPAIRFIIGAFIIRFQKIGFWILWVLWMLLVGLGSKIAKLFQDTSTFWGKLFRDVLLFLQGFPVIALYAMGAGAVFLLAFGAWLLIRRQQVTCA